MFTYIVDEIERFCAGKTLRGEVPLESLGRIG